MVGRMSPLERKPERLSSRVRQSPDWTPNDRCHFVRATGIPEAARGERGGQATLGMRRGSREAVPFMGALTPTRAALLLKPKLLWVGSSKSSDIPAPFPRQGCRERGNRMDETQAIVGAGPIRNLGTLVFRLERAQPPCDELR